MAASAQRYTAVAIVLHWAIAFGIAFMIPLGFWMHGEAEHGRLTPGVVSAYQLHKSVGLTILALSLARLVWRLVNPPPALPARMPGWEKLAAKTTHWLFYAIIILMPLTGWLYVSAGWSYHTDRPLVVTTKWFELISVPALFDPTHADEATRRNVAFLALRAHWAMAWGAIALALLHIGAALKHQFVDRDEVLSHMVPGAPAPNRSPAPRDAGRNAVLGGGLAAVAVAFVALLYAVTNLEPAAAPPPATQTTAEAPVTETTSTTATAEATTTTAPASAPAWTVNHGASSIAFAATYTDEESSAPINGRFTRWRADIRFDPANLGQSSAVVTIDLASVTTGAPENDQTLRGETWFNTGAYPSAIFRTTSIRHVSGGNYEARGTLTIKGHRVNVAMPFTLDIDGARATMQGRVTLNRGRFDIGVRDPTGNEHVGPEVGVTVRVEATRAQ